MPERLGEKVQGTEQVRNPFWWYRWARRGKFNRRSAIVLAWHGLMGRIESVEVVEDVS